MRASKWGYVLLYGLFLSISSRGVMAMTSDEEVARAYERGMTQYHSLYDFGRNQKITRQEFAKFLSIALKQQHMHDYLQSGSCSFNDTDKDESLVHAVQSVCSQGLMKGGGGYFGYTQPLQRSEMVSILVRLRSDPEERIVLLHAEHEDLWYTPYLIKAKSFGIQLQEKNIESFVSRGQALHYILRYGIQPGPILDTSGNKKSDVPEKTNLEQSSFLGLLDL